MKRTLALLVTFATLCLGVATVGPVSRASAADATLTVEAVALGEDLVLIGTGWVDASGTGGSVLSVLLDAARSGDPNTVHTKLPVTNPLTGEISGDTRLHAIVQADERGNWRAVVPFPDASNSSAGDTTPAWEIGTTHQIRALSGSLADNDVPRSVSAEMTIADPASPEPTTEPTPEPTPGPTENPDGGEPDWPHITVSVPASTGTPTATAWLSSEVATGDTSKLRIKGAGWTTADGTRASTIALKLNSGIGTQYTRSDDGIVRHPSATGDDTIWILLAPEDPESHPNVHTINSDGTFDIEFDAPAGLRSGQYLSALLQSGRFDSGDVTRSVTSSLLTVGGVPHTGGGSTDTDVTCVPTSSIPTVDFENAQTSLGGELHITGEGWCHPEERMGGSRIAIKIDEGAYSRLDSDVHQNRTIWAIIQADHATGRIDATITLPDGTDTSSTPSLTKGAHTLRLLSGSLTPGDKVRTLESGEFVVGDYRPNGVPAPIDATQLTADTAGGLTLERSAESWRVTIPEADEGTWVYPNLYVGASQRAPWGDSWFTTDADGSFTIPLDDIELPTGELRFTVQSGDQGHVGTLLGWTPLTIEAPAVLPEPTPTPPPAATTPTATQTTIVKRLTVPSVAAQTPARAKPGFDPQAPVERALQLNSMNSGSVTATLADGIATITVADQEPGHWVYLYLYPGKQAIGWVRLDDARSLQLDVAQLAPGVHKISVQDEDGALVGWTALTVEGDVPVTAFSPLQASASVSGQPVAQGAATADAPWLTNTDLYLAAGGVLIIGAATAIVLAQLRPRKDAS